MGPVDKKALGKHIQGLRKSKGLTQADLEASSGVSNRSIQQIESGETNPGLDTLDSLARALNVTVVSLVEVAARKNDPSSVAAVDVADALELLSKYQGLSPSLKSLACAVLYEDATYLRGIPRAAHPLLADVLEGLQKKLRSRA